MPKQQHFPWDTKSFAAGADTDHEKELFNVEGKYVDSRNARLTGDTGSDNSLEKIKGEVTLYPANFTTGNYFCIWAANINNDIVECWTDKNYTEEPLIRVNGVVVCKSFKLGWRADRPLQGDTNDSCVGGEFYVTDFEIAPYVFNVKDLVDSLVSAPTKYFSGFNPDLYKTSLRTTLDIPVFQELVNLGGGGGLPPGDYAYSIRYATLAGDKTNFSFETPTIAVPIASSSEDYEYRYIKTYGGSPSPSIKTSYGIKLKFRVTNLYNYEYIEVRRIAFNVGAGLTYIPPAEIIAKIPITPGQIDVITFVDPTDSFSEPLTVTDTEDLQQFSTFQTCKTLRYYNKRLVLMNLKYPSRKVENVQFIEDVDGETGFPVIYPLYDRGHSDAWNYTYRKNLMSAERYNHAAVVIDGSGGPSFAIEMTAAQQASFSTIPNHRDKLSVKSQNYCITKGKGAPVLSDFENNVNPVYEVWDLKDTVQKNGGDMFNLCNENVVITNPADPYKPLTPIGDSDGDTLGHRFHINDEVGTDATTWYPYNPKGYSLNWWSRGIAFNGIKKASLPDWAKAFSFVRTKAAKRVVCQGIGVYRMNPAVKTSTSLGYTTGVTKDQDTFAFHSADIKNGYVDAATLADMAANPSNYKVQLLSPIGYFSEMYNNIKKTLFRDRSADVISYARIQDENGTLNPTETSGQLKFGKYLNSSVVGMPATTGPDFANHKYGMESFSLITEGRNDYYTLKLDDIVYGAGSQGGSKAGGWDINEGKDFKEPFYIVNIIRDGALPPKGNTTNYIATGHYQKLTSIIGRSTGVPVKYDLIDERWEDCITNIHDPNRANVNTYLFIEDINGVDHVWLNVTEKTAAQRLLIFTDIKNLGSYNDGTYDIEGCYTSYNDSLERFYGVEFKNLNILFDDSMFIPEEDSLIKVKYDERFPILSFPGEHFVGETVFSPIDRYSPGDGNEPDETSQFLFASGLPYHRYKFNTQYLVLLKSYGPGNNVQDIEFKMQLDYIRQWVVMYPSESRSCLPLNWGSKFPNINYVMRPHKYQIGTNMATSNPKMYPAYFTDYPGEENYWGFGGFHVFPSDNPDYASTINDRIYTSKPLVGFKEQTDFCSRIIWSLERPINIQDSPGLKTFPSLNVKDISDNQGCIKYAYDANTGKGSNLYALCSRGICLLVTNKILLNDANAEQLAYAKTENFINDEYWMTKDVGVPNEHWRSIAETSSASFGKTRMDALFFANNESSFVFANNEVLDICKGDIGYHKRIFNQYSKIVKPDYLTHVCSGYDRRHEEYWLHIDTAKDFTVIIDNKELVSSSTIIEENKTLLLNGMHVSITGSQPTIFVLPEEIPAEPFSFVICNNSSTANVIKNGDGSIFTTLPQNSCVTISVDDGEFTNEPYTPGLDESERVTKTFVFNQTKQSWTGYFDYRYDKFLAKYHDTYGLRDLKTDTLNEGYVMNGGNIEYEAVQSHGPEPQADKEFIRIRINSSKKPTRVDFSKEVDGQVVSWMDQATFGPNYLKNYGGYEQYIPSNNASVDPNKKRFQNRLIISSIKHNLAEDFKLYDSGVQYKLIK